MRVLRANPSPPSCDGPVVTVSQVSWGRPACQCIKGLYLNRKVRLCLSISHGFALKLTFQRRENASLDLSALLLARLASLDHFLREGNFTEGLRES